MKNGSPYPIGASVTGTGVNFSVFSYHATGAELLLFDTEDAIQPSRIISLTPGTGRTSHYWHVHLPGIRPGQLYGYRISGPYAPELGHRFDPEKILLDPYARAISTKNYQRNAAARPGDNTGAAAKSVVADLSAYDWEDDRPLDHPFSSTVLYEMHVGGFTRNANSSVAEEKRGTYAGLVEKIPYLKDLGITAVELMPVFQFDAQDAPAGLENYWGYSPMSFFAPHVGYSSRSDPLGCLDEFRDMVKALHRAGIEVILDVVYNHTCEGNRMGPMLSMKGIDNTTYYRQVPNDPRYYMDYTGTGNTLNVMNPQVLKLVMDSLRYWVTEMHVDGFRFDLASTLARELHAVSKLSSFFDTIHQDPTLADVKLIAEPWDVGEGGYQVGNFPVLWAEWNGKYRDTVRRFWKGDSGLLSDFAYRLTGSSDLYQMDGRRPYASINFITAHDGFTLCDLVSYNEKHNEANGDNNSDGANDNDSWNMGAEGPTDDPAINELRERQMRNFLATLILSQGVPMVCGGDEFARSQKGNNNGYCQDNELTWYHWKLSPSRERLLEFTSKLIHLRRDHPNLHRRKFFQDRVIRGSVVRDIAWYNTDGGELSEESWTTAWNRSLALMLNGKTLAITDEDGGPIVDDSFLILVNAAPEGVEFTLPEPPAASPWTQVLNTENIEDPFVAETLGEKVIVGGRSMRIFCDGKR